jgi:ubiquinone/menaquinone biosynthesis C-methylase UbiE
MHEGDFTRLAASAKERQHRHWTEAAQGLKKHDARLTASAAPLTERMLLAARVGAGDRVLYIACGTGEPSLSAAEQVGAAGYVLGTDFAEPLLAFAREKAQRRGLSQVQFRRVDAEELEVAPGSFDAVLSRWGLAFMTNPIACLTRARSALRRGGRIAVACSAGPARDPAMRIALMALGAGTLFPLEDPDGFAFADGSTLKRALEAAGFADPELEQVEIRLGGDHSDATAFFSLLRDVAVPVPRLYAQRSPEQQRAAERAAAEAVEPFRRGQQIAVPALTWVAHAHV